MRVNSVDSPKGRGGSGSAFFNQLPHRLVKKGASRTFEQTPPHELGQAHCSRAAGHAAGCTVLRTAPGTKGRPWASDYQP